MNKLKANSQTWGHVWSHVDFDLTKDRVRVAAEEKSKRWAFMTRELRERFPKLAGLRSIEIGSGIGDYSLILAKLGTQVTLLDYSDEALRQAKLRFEAHGVRAEYVQADLLGQLPKSLVGKFDISMSFGLVEHFEGRDRLKVVTAHRDLLKPGGVTFISVPNKLSLPYRYWMARRKKAGEWEYGLEIPFSRSEIVELAKFAGLKDIKVMSTPVLADLDNFIFSGRLRRLVRNTQVSSPIDNILGYALVLAGKR